jgi:ankyrin repeat protein
MQRRVPVAAEPGSGSAGEVTVASADAASPRVEISGSSVKRLDAEPRARLEAVRNSSLALAGASARQAATPLHAAADRGDVEALKTLLAAPGARVDAPDAAGRTALLRAVQAQQLGAVRLLLAAGADPARPDASGLTPRAAAQAGANAEIAALLTGSR